MALLGRTVAAGPRTLIVRFGGPPRRETRLRGQTAESLDDYYSGRKLFGDDFSLDEIREWYGLEENACYEGYDPPDNRIGSGAHCRHR